MPLSLRRDQLPFERRLAAVPEEGLRRLAEEVAKIQEGDLKSHR